MARHIAEKGESTEWVQNMQLLIRKANLCFGAKFWWSIIRHRLSPTQTNNVVTCDHAVMLVALLVRLEIDFTQIIISEIHERAFRRTTTFPFPCLIFRMCKESIVSIWHCERLVKVTKTVDVRLIQDDTNPVAPIEMELDRLCFNVDVLLAPVEAVPETAPMVEADDLVLSALFGDKIPAPDPSCATGKHTRSSDYTSDADEARRARKNERQ
uniref:Putative plant transposon protein domain-containing protein n=1 Tax=Solanum tuberosum TaxID=4113 RepID=M1DEJ7_SOLTU